MTIDVENEKLLHFGDEAAQAFPGRKPSRGSMHRWRLFGIGPNRIKIETIKISGLRYTTKEAILRFVAAQNAGELPAISITPRRRARQAEAANAACIARGY